MTRVSPRFSRLLLLVPLAVGCRTPLPTRSGTGLEVYKREHYAAIPAASNGTAAWSAFDQRMRRLRLLLLGDDHEDRWLHERLEEVLERALDQRGRVVLLVEFVGEEDLPALERHRAGRCTTRELRRRLHARWPDSWMEDERFDAPFYRKLLELGARPSVTILPLEPIPRLPLRQRDVRMAQNIAAAGEAHPGSLIVVIVGHTHLLGPGHLLDRTPRVERLAILPRTDPEDARRQAIPRWTDAPFDRLTDDVWAFAARRPR